MRARLITLLFLSVTLSATLGCRRHAEKQQALPDKIPTPPEVKFSARDQGWPPRPLGRSKEVAVPWTPRASALTTAREAELQNIASQDSRVRTAMGERFAYITAAELDPDKAHPSNGTEAAAYRLTFYSYTHNIAVEVVMRGGRVDEVTRREGYQPAEGAGEIKAAIALAEQEPRLATLVQGMRATAIVTYPQQGQPGYGHRILHVSFSRAGGEEKAPLYYALVDLTELKVVAAGQPGER